jgi:hypothetical protein
VEGKTFMGAMPPWIQKRLEDAAAGIDAGTKAP